MIKSVLKVDSIDSFSTGGLMSEQNTAKIETLVPPSLYAKVQTAAQNEGLSLSAHLRRLLIKWHAPDTATLALPENRAILVDPGVEYVTGEGE
jgi:hypothetical protein